VNLAIAALTALLAALLGWSMLRTTLARSLFERRNYAGRMVSTGAGIVVVLVALGVEAAFVLVGAAGVEAANDGAPARRATLVVVLGLGLLGLFDDVGGAGDERGFAGHLSALRRGRLSTGAAKLLGGAALAVVAVAPLAGDSLGWLLADAALVALAANVANLLDRAPGRTTKVAMLAVVVLAALSGLDPALVLVAAVVGAAAGLLRAELAEQLMLGDAGANPLGGALGIGVVATCGPLTRGIVLAVLLALNLASEVVSFSQVIDKFRPLRAVDQLGRRGR